MRLITHGCRGSIPTPSKKMQKYGGNTTCFELQFDKFQIFFDTGSGFQNASLESNKEILIFFSHFHHDHIQGLAFNKYLLASETTTCISSALANSENLNKIEEMISTNKIDPKKAINSQALLESGVIKKITTNIKFTFFCSHHDCYICIHFYSLINK